MKAPDAFRTISETAEELGLPQHVLRFWETRFRQIQPMKRAGGRRFYRPDDVALLRGIRHLLYEEGLTIKGVQKLLKAQGSGFVVSIGEGAPMPAALLARGFEDEAEAQPDADSPPAMPEPDAGTAPDAPPAEEERDATRAEIEAALEHLRAARALIEEALARRSSSA